MSEATTDREARIEALVEQYLDVLQAGERPDRGRLLAAHPDLAEILDRRLALVEVMHRLAPSRADETGAPPEADGRAVRVRCPHCGHPIQLVEPRTAEVTCRNCGTSFPVEPDAAAPRAPDLLPRAVGKFQVLAVLGRGTFGTVYRATDPDLARTVAVKVPRAGYFASSEDEERFLREARSAAQLSHPGIVRVLEIARERGVPYIVSELIDGPTLAELLTASRPGYRESADLVARIADALAYAHQAGIIHRDIKPSNILLDPSGRPHLTDFGLARRDERETVVTLDGQILGTPAYMSPEQAAGDQHRVGPRSDVYSLGVVLYVLLTGELPFRGNSRMLLHQVLHDEPKPPRSLNDRIPRDLQTICLKSLAKEPSLRYPAAEDLAADLRRFLKGEPILARPAGLCERGWRWAKRHPAITSLLAVIVGGTALSLFLITWQWQRAVVARQEATARARAESQARASAEQAQRDEARARVAEEGQRKRAEAALEKAEVALYVNSIALAERYRLANDVARAEQILEGCPRALRHWEWSYLKRLCHPERATLRGHKGGILGVAYSPVDPLLASGGADRTVKLWDASTGQLVRTLRGHSCEVLRVVFSPDGQSLASAGAELDRKIGGRGELKIWDVASGRERLPLRGRPGPVTDIAFSPDGKRFACSSAGSAPPSLPSTLRIWDMTTWEERLAIPTPLQLMTCVAFSPDGKWLASGSLEITDDKPRGNVYLWDAANGRLIRVLRGHDGVVNRIAFSLDGRTLASASADRIVKLWETATGREIRLFRGHTAGVTGIAFNPDGQSLATSSDDWSVRLWDATSGREVRIFRGHSGPIADVTFSPDGRSLASAGGEMDHPQTAGDIRIWDVLVRDGVRDLYGHASFPTGIAFSPDGKSLASASHDQTVRVWDVMTGRETRVLRGHDEQVNDVAFHPDGKYLASAGGLLFGGKGEIKVWEVSTGREVSSLPGNPNGVASVNFSPDGRLLAASFWDQSVKIYNEHTWKEARAFKPEGKPEPFFGTITEFCVGSGRVVLGPDSRRLAAPGYGKSLIIWDAATGRELNTFVRHTARVLSTDFSPDGRLLASGSEDRTITIWDTTTGREKNRLVGHSGLVSRVQFSHDGKRLVSAGFDATIRIWDPILGLELLTLQGHTLPVRDVMFSPDGRRLASAAGEWSRPGDVPGELRIWEGETVFPERGR